MNYKKIVCFDLEHCCWAENNRIGEIIEIGVAEIDTASGDVRKSQYYVKPEKDEVSDYCLSLTGIGQKTVNKQGRPLGGVLVTLAKNYGGVNKIYACWGKDDEDLKKECENKGLISPINHCLNLAMLAGLQFRGSKNLSQVEVMDKFGLYFEGRRHSGVDDAYNLALLAPKLIFGKDYKLSSQMI